MAPLTFPNEKQMVSKEESALQNSGRWGRRDVVLGGSGGQQVSFGGLLPHMRDRRKKHKVFSAVGFLIFFIL